MQHQYRAQPQRIKLENAENYRLRQILEKGLTNIKRRYMKRLELNQDGSN